MVKPEKQVMFITEDSHFPDTIGNRRRIFSYEGPNFHKNYSGSVSEIYTTHEVIDVENGLAYAVSFGKYRIATDIEVAAAIASRLEGRRTIAMQSQETLDYEDFYNINNTT